jgi:plastocyanin
MLKSLLIATAAQQVAAFAPAPGENPVAENTTIVSLETLLDIVDEETRRQLFPLYPTRTKGARHRAAARAAARTDPKMSEDAAIGQKGSLKMTDMMGLNDDHSTVIQTGDQCSRRHAMARAAGLAAGLALSTVNAPGFAAATAKVKMGSDSGQLVFDPDEIKICKGDSVTWVNNKGGPHNVVFDEENIPSGVSQEAISMEDQLGEEGETFTRKFDVAGSYAYYCEPHRGAGMNAALEVA